MKQLFQSKTFVYLILIFLVATIALFLGKIAADLWIELIQWLGGFATIRGTSEQIQTTVKRRKDEIQKNLHNRSDSDLAADVVARTER
ncbi:MAG: hypothetical protein KBG83_00160 [Bacteroidetes bacterium]|nr:hypothetical protein [Bacteroidota bacterium]